MEAMDQSPKRKSPGRPRRESSPLKKSKLANQPLIETFMNRTSHTEPRNSDENENLPGRMAESDRGVKRRQSLQNMSGSRRLRISENESGDSDFEDDGSRSSRPQYPQSKENLDSFSKGEISRFVAECKKFGRPTEGPRLDKIAEAARITKSRRSLIELSEKLQQSLCEEHVQGNRGRGKKITLYGESISVKSLVSRFKKLDPLIRALPADKTERKRKTLELNVSVKSDTLGPSWGNEDDSNLLKGIYEHGLDNWEAIKEDPDLHLGDKILLPHNQKPQGKNLRTRADYLLHRLSQQTNDEAESGSSSDMETGIHRIKRKPTSNEHKDLKRSKEEDCTIFPFNESDSDEEIAELDQVSVSAVIETEMVYRLDSDDEMWPDSDDEMLDLESLPDIVPEHLPANGQASNGAVEEKMGNKVKLITIPGDLPEEATTPDESQFVEDDRYTLEGLEKLRHEHPEPENPVYRDTQKFLAEGLLERLKIIHGKALEESFDKICFQIYTPRAAMLQNQTRYRLLRGDTEFFSSTDLEKRKMLREYLKECVQSYDWRSNVYTRHYQLKREAKKNPKTLFLIVADEAHWGPTSESIDAPTADEVTPKKGGKAPAKKPYSTLINSWNDEEHPNVFVLQVSATPYNLLTENTRLDLKSECTWDVRDGIRFLRPLDTNDESSATGKAVLLHHMKWDELFEQSVQQGCHQVLKIPLKKHNGYIKVDGDGYLIADEEDFTRIHFKGESSGRVKIWIYEEGKEKILVVCEDKAGNRGSQDVRFLPHDELSRYRESLYTYNVTKQGQDVFLIETTDGKYKLKSKSSDSTGKVEAATTRKFELGRISREDCFVAWSCQNEGQLNNCKEYVSLNYLFNSMFEELAFGAYLRKDQCFVDLCDGVVRIIPKDYETKYDILTSDYAIHMLHISEIRECMLVERNLHTVLKSMSTACGEYTRKRDELIDEFKMGLTQGKDEGFSRIDPQLFEAVLAMLEEQTIEELRKSLERYTEGRGEEKDEPEDVCSYLVNCFLFLRKEALICLQDEIGDLMKSPEYSEVFSEFEKFDFPKHKDLRIKENETCRLIDNLVLKDDDKPLNGPMKIVRMTTDTGNRMYATLCLARKIASKNKRFTFEILRDYGNFKIRHVLNNTDDSSYRIQQVLQCKDCTHEDPKDGARCLCTNLKLYDKDLKCRNCHHRHKRVENYGDLKHLPLLLIMVGKGRMGDTFPENFNSMDLRVSSDNNDRPTLTPLVQELGRLCRYVEKCNKEDIPYALLGKGLADSLEGYREIYGTLCSGYVAKKDPYIDRNNKANHKHVDYKNKKKHKNRILFEAEPQIGKTGVYLCLIALLRRLIERRSVEEEVLDEEVEEEEEEERMNSNETAAENWKRPYWKQMKKTPPVLNKKATSGKYVPLFGPYCFGHRPEHIVGQIGTKKPETSSKIIKGSEFRTYSKDVPLALANPGARAEGKRYIRPIGDMDIRMSIPPLQRFLPLFEILHIGTEWQKEAEHTKNQEILKTWIFTPSHGRCRTAYLNFDHAMVDQHGKKVQYIQIIVVRPEEYEVYVRHWQYSHAVLCLPERMVGVDERYDQGGVGYARLFIQVMAKELKLKAVFMLDDTIRSFSEVKFTQDAGKEVVHQDNGKHSLVPISMYSCLHHLEQQLYGEDDPPPVPLSSFEPYPSETGEGTQRSFTGPWDKYGIIGVLRNNRYVTKYKRPFNRTHVNSAVLVNIEALEAKNLHYKPWQVWEDLEMNNQCDEKDLWVVKYNRYVIHKVYMSNWLPQPYLWNDQTVMSHGPASVAQTNCVITLRKYINLWPLEKIETVPSKRENLCQDVEKLTEKLAEQKQGHHLFVVDDEGTSEEEVQELVGTCFRSKGTVLLLLPTCVCEIYGLTTKKAVETFIGKNIDRPFVFDCVTSEDVTKKPVSLVLIRVQEPREVAGKSMTRGKPNTPRTQEQPPTVPGPGGDGPQDIRACTNCGSMEQDLCRLDPEILRWLLPKLELERSTEKGLFCDRCVSTIDTYLYVILDELEDHRKSNAGEQSLSSKEQRNVPASGNAKSPPHMFQNRDPQRLSLSKRRTALSNSAHSRTELNNTGSSNPHDAEGSTRSPDQASASHHDSVLEQPLHTGSVASTSQQQLPNAANNVSTVQQVDRSLRIRRNLNDQLAPPQTRKNAPAVDPYRSVTTDCSTLRSLTETQH